MKRSPEVTFLVAAIGGTLLLAILGMTLAEARRNATFPADSPQRAVQSYLEAISLDDKLLAFSYVAGESSCEQQDMDAAFGAAIDRTIVQFAHIDGDRGKVGIRLELGIGSIWGGRATKDRTFSLVRERGEWKLTGKIWPMDSCGA